MPEATFVHPIFGPVRFRTAHSTWVRGDHITFLSGFNTADIKPVTIPQLANIASAHNGRLRFHARAHDQVLMVFADIERLGLLHHIHTFGGSLSFRLRKPTSGKLSKVPSNHAFGIAIDLNSDDGSLGESIAPVAPVFEALKFKWGKSFPDPDPMHFEIESFLDHPRSIVQDVAVVLNDQNIDLGARNLMGDLVLDTSKLHSLTGVSTEPAGGSKMLFKGPARARKLSVQRFGDLTFASLPQLCGVAGLKMDYDNEFKIARLTNNLEA